MEQGIFPIFKIPIRKGEFGVGVIYCDYLKCPSIHFFKAWGGGVAFVIDDHTSLNSFFYS